MTSDTNYQRLVVAVGFGGALLVCTLMYANVFRHQPPPKWDEAQHMVFGWQIWADQADGSLLKLLKDSYAQFYWPFLHSWWVAMFMKAFGVTDRGARLSSFAAMLVTVPLAFWAGKSLFKERVPWAGLSAVALLLMLASLPGLAAQCMIELPATMLSFLALLIYILAEDHQTVMTHACFGCVLAAVFLIKYNFGLALIGAFVAVAATELLFHHETYHWQNLIAVLTPLAVVFLVWLVVPRFRVNDLFDVLANRRQGPQDLGWEYTLFYPKVVYADAGWWAVVLVGGLLNALRYLKNLSIRLLFCVCVFYGGIIFFHQTKDTRHIYPLYPALILLAAFALASGTSAVFVSAPRWRARLLSLVLVAMLLRPLAALAHPRMPAEQELLPAPIAASIGDQVHDRRRVFVFGEFNELPADLIAWELHKRGNRTTVYPSTNYKQALEGISGLTSGGSDTVDLAKVGRLLAELSADMVVTFSLEKASPFYDEDYRTWNAWKSKYVDTFASVPGYEKVFAKDYPAGISATVYRRRP